MKLPFLSYEALLWVLQSLRKDEMQPSERAIVSRAKEAFGVKIGAVSPMWEMISDIS